MTLVVMCLGATATLLQRQSRLCAIDSVLERRRILRWIQIQALHIAQPVDEIRILTHLEVANQMRLQNEFLPHFVHKTLRHLSISKQKGLYR